MELAIDGEYDDVGRARKPDDGCGVVDRAPKPDEVDGRGDVCIALKLADADWRGDVAIATGALDRGIADG